MGRACIAIAPRKLVTSGGMGTVASASARRWVADGPSGQYNRTGHRDGSSGELKTNWPQWHLPAANNHRLMNNGTLGWCGVGDPFYDKALLPTR